MNDIWLTLAFAGIFFGAMALRGVFGYLKNKKISVDNLDFSWKTFLGGSVRPILLTLSTGALAGLLLAFLRVVGLSGIEVAGLEQITPQTLELGLVIADVGAIGYAIKEALLCYGLTDKQIDQIRTVIAEQAEGEATGIAISYDSAELIAGAVNVKHDDGGADEVTEQLVAEMGATPYYKVDVSTPTTFYNATLGKGFDEGFGLQCVCLFKEFMYSLAGRYINTAHGAARDYAAQRAQIEPLGFTYYNDKKLQDGDWVILGVGAYGHVAMYYQGKLFGQNQGATNPNVGTPANLMAISLGSYLCHYRPNLYKKVTPQPQVDLKVGDTVLPIAWVDYDGRGLRKTRDYYYVNQISGDRVVLTADSVSGAVYAAVGASNLKKVSIPNSQPTTPSKPVSAPSTPIKAGDSVIAWGKGYATANLTGRRTREYPRTKMKVIKVYAKSLALNQYNAGEAGDLSQVTGFWPLTQISHS